jgi:outer membrane receptor for monomeric catechols
MHMKKTLLKATLILAVASSALASDKETKDAKDAKPSTASAAKAKVKVTSAPTREVVLTGSNIKRAVRKDGQVTDGPNSLTVIDRKTIERSGAADLRQVLARQSSFR